MTIQDFNYNPQDKQIYCITNIGVYRFSLYHFISLIPFQWDGGSELLKNQKIKSMFTNIMQDMYVENPEIFEYVQYTIYYTYRGSKKEVSYNIYLEALRSWQKMKDFSMYENITTNFDHNL